MTVRFELDGPVAIITIDRPARKNAVDGATAVALAEAFRRFAADESVSVAVLTGAAGCFCAGADLKAIASGGGNRLAPDGDGPMGPTRMLLDKPVIAAIEGFAVAGGLELACWCDLRVAARDASFGVLCRRWGVPLIDGGTIRLPRLIGMSHALDLIMTGREIDAGEAHRIGLVNRLCDSGDALASAIELARQLAALPQTCMREDRLSCYAQWELSLDRALAREFDGGMRVVTAPGFIEGVQAFAGRARRS